MSNRSPAFRNDGQPTGIQSISDRCLVAARMIYDENKSRVEVAKEMGVSLSTVRGWCEVYRKWLEDQRLIAAIKRTG